MKITTKAAALAAALLFPTDMPYLRRPRTFFVKKVLGSPKNFYYNRLLSQALLVFTDVSVGANCVRPLNFRENHKSFASGGSNLFVKRFKNPKTFITNGCFRSRFL